MAKYILIDETSADGWPEEYTTAAEAIDAGEKKYNHLTTHDKKERINFMVLESINPDPDAENHYDGNPVKVWIENGIDKIETREQEIAAAMSEMIALGWTLESFNRDFDTCDSADWTPEEKETCRRIFGYLWEETID